MTTEERNRRVLLAWAGYADAGTDNDASDRAAKEFAELGIPADSFAGPDPADVEQHPAVAAALRASTADLLESIDDPRARVRITSAALRRLTADAADFRVLRDAACGELKGAGVKNASIARVSGLSTARVAQLELRPPRTAVAV